ncbi:hypothetical protein [Luteibacter aegosomaticola]|nr:hypothetical protein [Luteibacter aegosomaticola]
MPRSDDRNLSYVAKKGKPRQDGRDDAIGKDQEKMDEASKRDESV